MSFIDALAKGICAQNAGLQAYVIRFTSGKHEGKYLGWDYNAVKTKRYAQSLVRHATKASWIRDCGGAIEIMGSPSFVVVLKGKGRKS